MSRRDPRVSWPLAVVLLVVLSPLAGVGAAAVVMMMMEMAK
jgi:hypothetical protein